MRSAAFLLLLSGPLWADVLVLKDGRKFPGKVAEKPGHYEVAGDGGLRTFLKDEVDRVLTDPKSLLGDSERLLEEVKGEYQKALEIQDLQVQGAKLKESIGKLTRARESFAGARELFPEDRFSDLDQKLVQVMQLMRLLRERVGSDIAGTAPRAAPAPVPAPVPAPAVRPAAPVRPPPAPAESPTLSLDEAFGILADPPRRADAAMRVAARDSFRARRASFEGGTDLATAAMLFLSQPEPAGKAGAALQAYFAKWLKEPAKLAPQAHLEAARYLASARQAEPAAAEGFQVFALGHLSHSAPGPETDRVAVQLGLAARGGLPATPEGHAARDLALWLASGDYDLAVLAYAREHKSAVDTPVVRFLWAYALTLQAQERKRGFDKAAAALEAVRPVEAPFRDHAAALAKSVRNAAVCNHCGGEAKVRCTGCHGKKEVRHDCPKCKGVGAVTAGGLVSCNGCAGRGYLKLLRCAQCKDGFPECRACDRKPRMPPAIEDLFVAARCAACEGTGSAFRGVAFPCRGCMGLGQKLTPRADPSKILP